MHLPQRHTRRRSIAGLLLALSVLLPAPAFAAEGDEPVVLTVGTTQDLDASNPFNTELVVGYEAFQLTYNLLTEFDKDAHPAPGFSDSWERTDDRVTFHIRDGMQWSDGTPATSKDVCYTWGLALAAIADESNIGSGYLDPGLSEPPDRLSCTRFDRVSHGEDAGRLLVDLAQRQLDVGKAVPRREQPREPLLGCQAFVEERLRERRAALGGAAAHLREPVRRQEPGGGDQVGDELGARIHAVGADAACLARGSALPGGALRFVQVGASEVVHPSNEVSAWRSRSLRGRVR